MNYSDIINVHLGLAELQKLKLPVRKGWAVYQLSKKIEDCYVFYCAEERKIATQYAMCAGGNPVITADGQISFSSPERKKDYLIEINALQTSFAGEFETIDITDRDIGGQTISPETIGRLSMVINFILNNEED